MTTPSPNTHKHTHSQLHTPQAQRNPRGFARVRLGTSISAGGLWQVTERAAVSGAETWRLPLVPPSTQTCVCRGAGSHLTAFWAPLARTAQESLPLRPMESLFKRNASPPTPTGSGYLRGAPGGALSLGCSRWLSPEHSQDALKAFATCGLSHSGAGGAWWGGGCMRREVGVAELPHRHPPCGAWKVSPLRTRYFKSCLTPVLCVDSLILPRAPLCLSS